MNVIARVTRYSPSMTTFAKWAIAFVKVVAGTSPVKVCADELLKCWGGVRSEWWLW